MNDQPGIVLIVDDSEAKRHSIAKILRKAGFSIKEAVDGREGLRLAAERPALIILDVKLPDLSGFEVCRRIKEDPLTSTIPVLHISTTFVDIDDRIQGLDGGADGYLTDVLEPLELIATVKALLRARNAEEAARLSNRQWQVTFDSINDGVVLLARDGRVIQGNPAMEGILGMDWRAMVGQNIVKFLPPPPGTMLSPFELMLINSRREETELMLSDRWFRVTFDPLRDGQGIVKGGLCIASDITDRRRLEETLRRRAEELALADRRKDEFLAMLAHELRNPLAPISNALEAIRLGKNDESLMEETLDIAKRQVDHMARLLDDLLDVSRFTRGNVELKLRSLELSTILKQAVETSLPLIISGQHELITSIPETPVWLEGDPTRLAQVVANLLNNAAKYTSSGGRIALQACCDAGEVVIRVEDNGIGLSAEMLPRVFDMFAQETRSIDRSQGGLGIGLTLVQSLVQLHGGSIGAESPGIGLGSTFTIRLPINTSQKSAPVNPNRKRASLQTGSQNHSILVVDDSLDSARSLARVLTLWGHQVRVAHDGPGAIDAALSEHFDIIFLDIGLPGMDGLQVAERLRQEFGPTGPVMLALTGYGQEEDIARSLTVGFDNHFVKPVDLDRLRELLGDPKLLAGRERRRVV